MQRSSQIGEYADRVPEMYRSAPSICHLKLFWISLGQFEMRFDNSEPNEHCLFALHVLTVTDYHELLCPNATRFCNLTRAIGYLGTVTPNHLLDGYVSCHCSVWNSEEWTRMYSQSDEVNYT